MGVCERFLRLPQKWPAEQRIFTAQILDRVVRSGGNIVLTIFIARVLGSNDYGILAFLLTVVGFASVFSTLGLANYTLINFSRLPVQAAEMWLSTLVFLRQSGAVVAVLATTLFLAVVRGMDMEIVLLGGMIACSQLLQSLDCYESYYLARGKVGTVLLARWVSFAVLAGAKVAACLLHAPLGLFALLAGLDLGLYGVAYLLLNPASRPRLRWRAVRRPIAVEALKACGPLVLSGVTVLVYMRYDQFLISRYRGDADLGVYAVAVVIAELWNFVANALSVAFTPRLTTVLELNGAAAYHAFFCRLSRYAFWGSCCYALVIWVLSGPLIRLLYGSEFAAAAQILRILCWTAPFIAIGILNSIWMIHHGAQSTWLLQTLTVASFSVVANQFVVPRFGTAGAASVLLISQALACFFLNGIFKATRELFAIQLWAIFDLRLSSDIKKD